jgi:hypothetical protein
MASAPPPARPRPPHANGAYPHVHQRLHKHAREMHSGADPGDERTAMNIQKDGDVGVDSETGGGGCRLRRIEMTAAAADRSAAAADFRLNPLLFRLNPPQSAAAADRDDSCWSILWSSRTEMTTRLS